MRYNLFILISELKTNNRKRANEGNVIQYVSFRVILLE